MPPPASCKIRYKCSPAHSAPVSPKKPLKIVTEAEATANEKNQPKGKKTGIYHADNVRDFGFANSRKFIWDAQGHTVDGQKTLAMSYYPKEGNPLWERYSTAAIVHTLNVFSKFSFTYPYPIAISVNGPVGGMATTTTTTTASAACMSRCASTSPASCSR